MPRVIELEELQSVYDEVSAQFLAADYSDALKGFADTLGQKHAEYFESEQSPTGQRWEPWHYTTIPYREHKTLDLSGTLKASLTQRGSGHVEDIGPREMTWGTSVPYAWAHQEGALVDAPWMVARGQGRIRRAGPIQLFQREHVGMNEETLDLLVEAVADATVEAMKE